LRCQGLLAGRWYLDPEETLSPGQQVEIEHFHEPTTISKMTRFSPSIVKSGSGDGFSDVGHASHSQVTKEFFLYGPNRNTTSKTRCLSSTVHRGSTPPHRFNIRSMHETFGERNPIDRVFQKIKH
jgi:hypothetical protein